MQQIPAKQIPVQIHNPGQKNGKIYVRLTSGLFQNLRRLISGSMMLMFFGTAWINLDGHQIVLFDFFSRRIHLFGLQLSPQDLFLLAGFMIVGAVLLFAMAMAYSRIWCGFACPQSIWSWIFIRIEDMTEGSRNKRIKRDMQGLNSGNLLRRIIKHSLWLVVATATAITFIGYFVPIREIATDVLNAEMSLEMFSWILIFALLTYVNAGLTREKVCLHMCPYARFQSVMFDEDTRVVSYNSDRGEPRAKPGAKPGTQSSTTASTSTRTKSFTTTETIAETKSGDCVDCHLCVHVCPTGIDIRHGLQADCIACGACIDVCDQVMTKLKRPTGLIRFISANQEAGNKSALLRPRLIGYFAAILLISGYLGWEFSQREALIVDISKDRQFLYQHNSQGQLCNDYQMIIENLAIISDTLNISVEDKRFILFGSDKIKTKQGQREEYRYRICTEQATGLPPRTDLQFLISNAEKTWRAQSTFIAPR